MDEFKVLLEKLTKQLAEQAAMIKELQKPLWYHGDPSRGYRMFQYPPDKPLINPLEGRALGLGWDVHNVYAHCNHCTKADIHQGPWGPVQSFVCLGHK